MIGFIQSATRRLLPLTIVGMLATPASVAAVHVTTDQGIYDPGESVLVTVTNVATETAFLSGGPPFFIRRVADDQMVAPCLFTTGVLEMEPGTQQSYLIEQLDCATELPAPWAPGVYEVVATYGLFTDPPTHGVATILLCVGPGCQSTSTGPGVVSESWGRVKARYGK